MNNVNSSYFYVFINGKELDQARRECIVDVQIVELCDGSNTCTINISDPDFLFISDNIFIEEAKIHVEMGLQGDIKKTSFNGYISAIDIDFPDVGFPTLSIYCLDESHIMNRKKKKRSWDNTTSAEIIKKIAKEYGFKCVVETGYTFKAESTISQSNETDISFCEKLAKDERELFMCKLVGDTLYYIKKGLMKEPSATVCYKEKPFDVIRFSPHINKETKQESVSVSDIKANDKKTDSGTASGKTDNTQGETIKTTSNGYYYSALTGKWHHMSTRKGR